MTATSFSLFDVFLKQVLCLIMMAKALSQKNVYEKIVQFFHNSH